nr:MAG TPA: hypothetical protein [Inoviridae sp.]
MVATLYWVSTSRSIRQNSSPLRGVSPRISANWSSTPQKISHSWRYSSAVCTRPVSRRFCTCCCKSSGTPACWAKWYTASAFFTAAEGAPILSYRSSSGSRTFSRMVLISSSRAWRSGVISAPYPSGFAVQATSRSHIFPRIPHRTT